MKDYQFEEITAALSIIIALLAWHFGVKWLYYIFLVKSITDVLCALRVAYKAVKDELKENNKENKL